MNGSNKKQSSRNKFHFLNAIEDDGNYINHSNLNQVTITKKDKFVCDAIAN